MKILVVSQYFWPESFVINDLTRTLSAQGHKIVIATGKPNYPDGKIFPGYRAFGVLREKYSDAIDIVRVPLWPRGKGDAPNLISNYISFVFSGLLFFPWLLRGQRFDAIVVFGLSPITLAIPAIPIKWLKRAHLALWVQDLWPESLAATGFVKNKHLLKLVGYLVKAIYASCDTILVQSRAFSEPVSKYAQKRKIVYYPNSISIQETTSEVGSIPAELASALQNSFSVVFAGNLGTAQAVETLLEAAIQLKSSPEIRLILVGSGSRLEWLEAQKQEYQLDNLLLPGRFPAEMMSQIFERASALLVSLKDDEVFAQTVPSKIQAYLAAGRPIIAALRGEGAQVVIEAGAGKVCEPENAAALAALIKKMQSLPALNLEQMGRSGRKYFNEHFEMGSQAARLVEILKSRSERQ